MATRLAKGPQVSATAHDREYKAGLVVENFLAPVSTVRAPQGRTTGTSGNCGQNTHPPRAYLFRCVVEFIVVWRWQSHAGKEDRLFFSPTPSSHPPGLRAHAQLATKASKPSCCTQNREISLDMFPSTGQACLTISLLRACGN